MPCPLAKTPLAPVRAGWVVVVMGDNSGSFWVASAVFDECDALIGGGLELGPDVGSAYCCVAMGVGVTRDGAAVAGRTVMCVAGFSRGSTETLTGRGARDIDSGAERSGVNVEEFASGARVMGSAQPCLVAMRWALDN
jgi:hypothetical protein